MFYNVSDREVVNEGAYQAEELAGQSGTVIEIISTTPEQRNIYSVMVLLKGGSLEMAGYFPDTCVKLDDDSLNWEDGYQAFDVRDLSLATT